MSEPALCYRRRRFPLALIAHVVWLYLRFSLSLRAVEDLLIERGVKVSYETLRRWIAKFGPDIARGLRRRQVRPSDVWRLDQVQVSIRGRRLWLWRAVDERGVVLERCRLGGDPAAASGPEGGQAAPAAPAEESRPDAKAPRHR
jgi:putative transposase